MKLELDDLLEITTKKADDRGRICLGNEYADAHLKVVVVREESDAE